MKFVSPQIICPDLPEFNAKDLNSVIQAFQTAPSCSLRQSWLAEAEPDFEPAFVRVGWQGQTLLFLAELKDSDIFTFARNLNEKLWELGDTLEIFLRPMGQTAYSEFHIAPNNLKLQLRFPDAAVLQQSRQSGSFSGTVIHDIDFDSHTWIFSESRRWYAFVKIPVRAACDEPMLLTDSKWLFSFCRYDYTRGRSVPVVSSTSAHLRPDFHCQAEWGTMRFQSGQPKEESAKADLVSNQKGGLSSIT